MAPASASSDAQTPGDDIVGVLLWLGVAWPYLSIGARAFLKIGLRAYANDGFPWTFRAALRRAADELVDA